MPKEALHGIWQFHINAPLGNAADHAVIDFPDAVLHIFRFLKLMVTMPKEAMKLVANNKKAYHDYFIEEKYEAGIELHGTRFLTLKSRSASRRISFLAIS